MPDKNKNMKLANEIQRRLIGHCKTNRNEIVLPNFFIGRWEMDVMKITGADFVIEYEIKISRSDYFADFKKKYTTDWYKPNPRDLLKHDLIKSGEHSANRFYFVVPENLISVAECPKYAGLMYYNGFYFEAVKNAPILHKRQFADYKSISQTMAGREHFLRIRLRKSTP